MPENDKTYQAKDIANLLVHLMSDSYDDLTNMKLNKLLYYAQGHYMQTHDFPLFKERIEAWKHGPAVPDIYRTYKQYSDQPIINYDVSRVDEIDDDVKSFLLDIARVYGRYTASTLRNMTHKPKTPWSMVNDGREIPVQLISEYFKKNESIIQPLELDYTEEDYAGQRDSEGVLVLLEDWQDAEI